MNTLKTENQVFFSVACTEFSLAVPKLPYAKDGTVSHPPVLPQP